MKGAGLGTWRCVAFAAAAAACVGLTGCASGAGATTGATVPDTTIPPANDFSVPAHITVAYVQRVLNALDAVKGDAARLIIANKSLVPDAVYRLEAIDADRWFTEETSTWSDDLSNNLVGYRPDPGNEVDTVQRVISASPRCVWAQVTSDFSAISAQAPPPSMNFVELQPRPLGHDRGGWNRTPWVIGLEGYNSQGKMPEDPCAASQ